MIEYLFLLALIFIGYFILSHLRPLNNNEIIQLGSKRRTSEIKNYYTFDRSESVVNKSFKSGMDTAGKYYHVNERLTSFPSTAAALLKYKKHEWVIIGF